MSKCLSCNECNHPFLRVTLVPLIDVLDGRDGDREAVIGKDNVVIVIVTL